MEKQEWEIGNSPELDAVEDVCLTFASAVVEAHKYVDTLDNMRQRIQAVVNVEIANALKTIMEEATVTSQYESESGKAVFTVCIDDDSFELSPDYVVTELIEFGGEAREHWATFFEEAAKKLRADIAETL